MFYLLNRSNIAMDFYKIRTHEPIQCKLSKTTKSCFKFLRPVCTITVDILKFSLHSSCMHGHAFDLL